MGWAPRVGGEEKDLGEGAAAAQDGSWASLEVLPRGVSQAVPPQITVSPEHFAAPLAAVGLDVCMGEKVSFQITSLIKGSSTCGAFVWRFLFRCEARQRINPSHHHGHPPQQFPQHQALTQQARDNKRGDLQGQIWAPNPPIEKHTGRRPRRPDCTDKTTSVGPVFHRHVKGRKRGGGATPLLRNCILPGNEAPVCWKIKLFLKS